MNAINITDQNFQDLILGGQPAMINFSADWCGSCKAVSPVFEQLALENDDSFLIGKLDVDENPITPSKYGIRSIPTFLFFKNGELVDRIVGAVPKITLDDKLNSLR